MKKISNLRKIILLIIFFVIEFLFTIVTYQFLGNDSIFKNHGLLFRGKYSLQL